MIPRLGEIVRMDHPDYPITVLARVYAIDYTRPGDAGVHTSTLAVYWNTKSVYTVN